MENKETNKVNLVIKITIGVLVLLLLLYFTRGWWSNKVIERLGGYTKKDIEITIDTISKRYDTIYPKYKELVTKVKVLEDREVVNNYYTTQIVKEITKNGDTIEVRKPVTYPLVYRHLNPISDSLIDGNIETFINPLDSKIVDQTLRYKPKFPIFIKEYITIEKKVTETLSIEPKNKIGFGIRGTSEKEVGVIGVYQLKNNWQFQVDVNKNLDERAGIDRSKNTIGFGIIKIF